MTDEPRGKEAETNVAALPIESQAEEPAEPDNRMLDIQACTRCGDAPRAVVLPYNSGPSIFTH